MEAENAVYIRLQRHLNHQAVGFPATASRVEIKILKHIFTPLEAQIATCLTYRLEPIETIFARAGHRVESTEKLAAVLDGIQKKGGLESKVKHGRMHYGNAPLVVGMYEFQLERLTPAFIKDFKTYTGGKKFGIEFLSTELPQMRTIPVEKSIRPQHHISTFDAVTTLLRLAEPPFVIIECICRKKKALAGEPCKVTDRKETCLAIGHMAQLVLAVGAGREIDREEMTAIIAENQKQGLVLQPSNSEKAEFICSCCGCCCGMLDVHKRLPKPLEFWATNFHAFVDSDACDGCGACEKRCQVGAVGVPEKKHPAVVDPDRCLGCGLCVPTCPKNAISLRRNPTQTRPPETREDLYDIIMAKKKGRLGKIKLTGKLIVDAIRTGRTDLLK